jgi:hypothetical protein
VFNEEPKVNGIVEETIYIYIYKRRSKVSMEDNNT